MNGGNFNANPTPALSLLRRNPRHADHQKIPADFPIKLEDDEEPIDLTQKNEFYNEVKENNKDISIIYATSKIFVIASGSEEFIIEFNKYINNYFSF